MLTSGSMVLIRESGTRKPVDELIISDLVFDPWAQKYVEVIDILSRTIRLEREAVKQPLYPVQLRAGCIAEGCPEKNLLVSPSLGIYHIVKSSNLGERPSLQISTALSMCGSHIGNEERLYLPRITYFAIFTEKRQIIDVSGLMVSTLCPDIFEAKSSSSEAALDV